MKIKNQEKAFHNNITKLHRKIQFWWRPSPISVESLYCIFSRKVTFMANKLRHREFAVIGLGRFGSGVALTLEAHDYHVLGIDQNLDIVQRLSDRITHVAALDATDEEALREIDIISFDTVIVAIGDDFEANLLTTVALKSLGVHHVICKAPTRRQQEILLKVGADRVIQPEFDAGRRLADELSTPTILEKLTIGPNHSMAELVVPKSMANRSLAQLDLRSKYGVAVLLVQRGDHLEVSPRADFILLPGDLLFILGRNERVQTFCAHE
jgi:trk system potassium uptake protein TrkA